MAPSGTCRTRCGCALPSPLSAPLVLGGHCCVELLAEFAPQTRHSPLGFFRELLPGGAVVDGLDGFAYPVGEVFEQRLHLLLQIAHLRAPFLQAFALETAFLPRHLLLPHRNCSRSLATASNCAWSWSRKPAMLLDQGFQPRARLFDDRGFEAQPLRHVDSRRGTGYAQPQLVGRRERLLGQAGRGIDRAALLRRVDLERGVVGRDQAPGLPPEQVAGGRDRKGRSLFRVRRRAQLVQKHQRRAIRQARDAIQIDDVRREGREVVLNRLRIADVGENMR